MEGKETDKLKWCFRIKEWLKIVEPSERLSYSYLQESKSSLERAIKNFQDKDLLWATIVLYYAEYYALYSFLQRIGVKCENHSCSILLVSYLLGEDKIKIINEHKDKRIDAQYYMKFGKEWQVESMLNETKEFVSFFNELISNLKEKDINTYKNKLKEFSNGG